MGFTTSLWIASAGSQWPGCHQFAAQGESVRQNTVIVANATAMMRACGARWGGFSAVLRWGDFTVAAKTLLGSL